jgi:two-component system response regulator YesN
MSYKVVISDDNPIICQALVNRIPWDDLGLEILKICNDGSEVLELLNETAPDILITDIRMPNNDGLAVIEQIRMLHLPVQFIIISGYNDFIYLKKAIDFEVVGYLMKPIQDQELFEYLNKAISNLRELEKAKAFDHSYKMLETKEQISKANYCLLQLIKQQANSQDLSANLPGLAFPKLYAWLFFQVPGENQFLFSRMDFDELEILQNKVSEFFGNDSAYIMNVQNFYAVLCPVFANTLSDKAVLKTIELFETHFHPVNYVKSDIFKSFDTLMPCFYHGICKLHTAIFSADFEYYSETDCRILSLKNRQELRMLLSINSFETAAAFIRELFEKYAEDKPTVMGTNEFFRNLVDIYADYITFFSKKRENVSSQLLLPLLFSSRENFYMLFSQTQNWDINKYTDKIEYVISFIEQNYMHQITLADLSRRVYFNSIYLGQLIKHHTGLSFNQYVNKLRIDNAVNIIKNNPTVKLLELSEELGFSDNKYFSKVFKKVTGLSPSQFILKNS